MWSVAKMLLCTERPLSERTQIKPVDRVWLMTGFAGNAYVLTLVKMVSIMILFTACFITFAAMYEFNNSLSWKFN